MDALVARRTSPSRASAQEMQDNLFRRMSAEEKIRLASDFFRLAQLLKASDPEHGTGDNPPEDRRGT